MTNSFFPPNYLPPNRVLLQNVGGKQVEAPAGATVPVGALCRRDSSGNIQTHNVIGGVSEKLFALERAYEGAVGGQLPKYLWDDYLTGELVIAQLCGPGSVVLARIAQGEAITVGMYLYSNGNGDLIGLAGTTTSTTSTTPAPDTFAYRPIGVSLDALNLITTTTSTTLAAGQTNPSNTPFNTVRCEIV